MLSPALAEPCYLCSGDTVIPVSVWEGDEVVVKTATCVRCRGEGVITDGFGIASIAAMPKPLIRLSSQTCECDFAIHGPMGKPDCPAR